MSRLTWVRGSELPSAEFWWTNRQKALIDFSSGYTFTLKIGKRGAKALTTKTTGITGAVGSGLEPTGVPNLTVSWSTTDLDIAGGDYDLTIVATNGSSQDRILYDRITIIEAMR